MVRGCRSISVIQYYPAFGIALFCYALVHELQAILDIHSTDDDRKGHTWACCHTANPYNVRYICIHTLDSATKMPRTVCGPRLRPKTRATKKRSSLTQYHRPIGFLIDMDRYNWSGAISESIEWGGLAPGAHGLVSEGIQKLTDALY